MWGDIVIIALVLLVAATSVLGFHLGSNLTQLERDRQDDIRDIRSRIENVEREMLLKLIEHTRDNKDEHTEIYRDVNARTGDIFLEIESMNNSIRDIQSRLDCLEDTQSSTPARRGRK